MKTGQSDRRGAATKAFAGARRIGGRRPFLAVLPDDARDLIARAEKLVYLFPDGFEPDHLIADQIAAGDPRIFDFDSLVEPDEPSAAPDGAVPLLTFVGRGGPGQGGFAVEVRPRSATIVADAFSVRRDLLLTLKEYAEARQEAVLRGDAA